MTALGWGSGSPPGVLLTYSNVAISWISWQLKGVGGSLEFKLIRRFNREGKVAIHASSNMVLQPKRRRNKKTPALQISLGPDKEKNPI